MKIALLVRDLRPGGVPSLIGPLARRFQEAGHRVCVYSLGLPTEIARPLMDGVEIISGGRPDGSGYGGHWDAFKKFKEWVVEFRPHVLQSHVGLPDIYAAFAPVPAGSVKVRAALAPELFPAQPWFGYFFERAIARFRFDHQVAVSEGVAKMLARQGVGASKTSVIANPISEQIESAMKALVPLDSPTLKVGYLGRLSPEKGPDRLIRWWGKLLPRLPSGSKIFIAGMGAMEFSITADIAALGLGSSIEVVGYQNNPSAFLPGLHCVISPSRYEGLPIAMIEAAALGCAVAATKTDGAEALARLAHECLIFPNQDELSDEWAEKLSHFMIHAFETRRSERKVNLTEAGSTEVTSQAVAEKYLKLYARLVPNSVRA